MKILLLLISLNCIAEEQSECGQNLNEWEEMREEDGRCYGVVDNKVVESYYLYEQDSFKTVKADISVEELETDFIME